MIDSISEKSDSSINMFMSINPFFISPDYTVNEALEYLGAKKIPNTFVVDKSGTPLGIIHLKQLT